MSADPNTPDTVEPRYRLRADLRIGTQTFADEISYVLKDPISLNYFRFKPSEYQVLQLIRNVTADELCAAIERELQQPRPQLAEIQPFLGQLLSSDLVTSDRAGHGQQLHARKLQLEQRKRTSALSSLLYIKFPGLDPERVLGWLYPKVRFLYSRWGVLLAVGLMLFAGGFLLVHLDEFLVRIRKESLQSFFSVNTLFWLWLALGISKVIHEFGHGLTCRHFGGECHDMGVLLMVFSPCLYCDTTDAWTMSNKWHRIAISAAGIYVELVIASVSSLVWWYTAPGVLHSVALAMMTLSSLTTFLVNANPLLRYDGYYVLADWVEIPNLRQKSALAFQAFTDRWLFGIETTGGPKVAGNRWFFLTYAVLSWLYKWLLTATILWFFYTVLRPYRLSSLSLVLAAAVGFQMIVGPFWRSIMRFSQATRQPGRVRWWRVAVSLLVLGGIGYAAYRLPLPRRVNASCIVDGTGQQPVFATVDGRIQTIEIQPGQLVEAGDPLVRLENPAFDEQIQFIEHRLRSLDLAAEKSRLMNRQGDEVALLAVQEELRKELESRKADRERLTIRATVAGEVVPTERELAPRGEAQGIRPLGHWEDHPLKTANLGATLTTGTVVCEIRPLADFELQLFVEQSDVSFVEVGQSVRIKLDGYPDAKLTGEVFDISRRESSETPPQLLVNAGGELPVRIGESGAAEAAGVYYRVRCRLRRDDDSAPLLEHLRTGMRGRAKVETGHWTAFEWGRRELHKLFHL